MKYRTEVSLYRSTVEPTPILIFKRLLTHVKSMIIRVWVSRFKLELSLFTLVCFLRINNVIKIMANCLLPDGPPTYLSILRLPHPLTLPGTKPIFDFYGHTDTDLAKPL